MKGKEHKGMWPVYEDDDGRQMRSGKRQMPKEMRA